MYRNVVDFFHCSKHVIYPNFVLEITGLYAIFKLSVNSIYFVEGHTSYRIRRGSTKPHSTI